MKDSQWAGKEAARQGGNGQTVLGPFYVDLLVEILRRRHFLLPVKLRLLAKVLGVSRARVEHGVSHLKAQGLLIQHYHLAGAMEPRCRLEIWRD